VSLERGPLSLVSTIEELFGRNSSGSGLDSREYSVRIRHADHVAVSTIEELLRRKISGFGVDSREYGRRDPSHRPHGAFYLQKLALTSPTSCGRSVDIVRSRPQATEFVCLGC
jgi:hypothetical protein